MKKRATISWVRMLLSMRWQSRLHSWAGRNIYESWVIHMCSVPQAYFNYEWTFANNCGSRSFMTAKGLGLRNEVLGNNKRVVIQIFQGNNWEWGCLRVESGGEDVVLIMKPRQTTGAGIINLLSFSSRREGQQQPWWSYSLNLHWELALCRAMNGLQKI